MSLAVLTFSPNLFFFLFKLRNVAFQLVGHARAIANLSLGQVTLDPIKFNVTSGLEGLEGLQGLTVINGVDVVGGTTTGITLAINVTITNPSNLNLTTGDLSESKWGRLWKNME